MTDKQRIIDGVDVKDCKRRIGKDNFCRYYKRPCAENNYNCIWKKYLRKEQECEKLKNIINEAKNSKLDLKSFLVGEAVQNEYEQQLDKLKVENEKISKGYAELTDIVSPYIDDFTGYNEKLGGFDIILCIKELLQQLDQPKVDKDELEKELRQKKMTILMNNDHYFEVGQTNKKLKQTLQEIKAICNNNDELQGDFNVVDCDKYKLGKHNLANKILQKISECEVEE